MAVLKIFIQHQSSIIGPTTLLDNIAFGATIKRQRMLRVCIVSLYLRVGTASAATMKDIQVVWWRFSVLLDETSCACGGAFDLPEDSFIGWSKLLAVTLRQAKLYHLVYLELWDIDWTCMALVFREPKRKNTLIEDYQYTPVHTNRTINNSSANSATMTLHLFCTKSTCFNVVCYIACCVVSKIC